MTRALLVLVLVGVPVVANPTPASRWPRTASDSPRGAVLRLGEAYENRNLEAYEQIFTVDYRFHHGSVQGRALHPHGMTRDQEAHAAARLFEDLAERDCPCGARRISVELRPLVVMNDPERPDRPDRFQLVIARDVRVLIDHARGPLHVAGRHEFHVVRGEAASLSQGQRADADHWYVWKWVEAPAEPHAAR